MLWHLFLKVIYCPFGHMNHHFLWFPNCFGKVDTIDLWFLVIISIISAIFWVLICFFSACILLNSASSLLIRFVPQKKVLKKKKSQKQNTSASFQHWIFDEKRNALWYKSCKLPQFYSSRFQSFLFFVFRIQNNSFKTTQILSLQVILLWEKPHYFKNWSMKLPQPVL